MSGYVAWRGMSPFDSTAPLVVIVTEGSSNRKTGDMDQAWILRSDTHPLDAVHDGKDVAICGSCRHRGTGAPGSRSCYVTVQHGPSNIYKAYQRGYYPVQTPQAAARRLRGRFLRIGAYGDPSTAPFAFWRRLTSLAAGWTGYTHFWRTCDPRFRQLLMASVDTERERTEALARGWRTFRVRQQPQLLEGELVCPASAEAHHRTTCQQCRICSGTSGRAVTRSVAILPHGKPLAFYRSSQQLLPMEA